MYEGILHKISTHDGGQKRKVGRPEEKISIIIFYLVVSKMCSFNKKVSSNKNVSSQRVEDCIF